MQYVFVHYRGTHGRNPNYTRKLPLYPVVPDGAVNQVVELAMSEEALDDLTFELLIRLTLKWRDGKLDWMN